MEKKVSKKEDFEQKEVVLDKKSKMEGAYLSLKEKYKTEIIPALMKDLDIKNIMSVPRLKKICVNQGIGVISGDKKKVEEVRKELSDICGQQAVIRKAKKSISNFKLSSGASVGCFVTLRGTRMYEFLDKLVNVVLPRIRDFRGLEEDCFDKTGIYNLGIKEQIIFPEVSMDRIVSIIGMNISIITSSKDKAHNLALFKLLGFPFKKK